MFLVLGDFVGLTRHLDYLEGLGVTAIWVTPPFLNKPMQQGTAGYHGYWILDFLAIDPHLGTNEEYREFIRAAHARGMRVYMDIIVNHTADVIQFEDGYDYVPTTVVPTRDAAGEPFDERAVAYNGLVGRDAFPALAAETSFARRTYVPDAEATAKNPAWLNDVTLYHNRGNTDFSGENAIYGDFAGLDDTFTEHPAVVEGFIEIFTHWLEVYEIDGYRIDTARHVNAEFWQAFSPAIRARARELGRPDFLQFGEVYNEAGDAKVLSEFSTGTIPIDTTIDFGMFAAARRFVSTAGTAAAFVEFIASDDYYLDHDSNIHSTTTFLGNHDAGRFGYFLQQDNPGASLAQLEALTRLGHGLLYLARGQPVIYYGDEQGMIGRGGHDMQARESLFAAQAPDFRDAPLLGTERTGADDKYDPTHPLYRLFARLGALRRDHPALRVGAMIPRGTDAPGLLAFSRLERGEQVEYLVLANNSRRAVAESEIATSQPAGAVLECVFDSREADAALGARLVADARGAVRVAIEPLQFSVWRAAAPLPVPAEGPSIALVNPASGAELSFSSKVVDGLTFPSRQEIRAEVLGGDGLAEVTFVLQRASRPGQYELLGTDDAPPYRVFWRPPSDLAAGEQLSFIATVSNLRGHHASDRIDGVTLAPHEIEFGIEGATVPLLTSAGPAEVVLPRGDRLELAVEATGTGPLEYQWIHDDAELEGATTPRLVVEAVTAGDAGRYRVLVRNRAGTTVSEAVEVRIEPRD